jgi:hypothetical protein
LHCGNHAPRVRGGWSFLPLQVVPLPE